MLKAIYKITNAINNKSYIGQSIDPQHRFVSHCSRAKNDNDNSPIHSAIKKYGKENFKLEILEWTEDYNKREKELIKEYNTLSPNGYNICEGGEEPPTFYGESHPNCRISEDQVDMVISMLKENILTEPEIGNKFDPPFSQSLIHNINFGITHKRKNEIYPIRKECPYNLSEKEVDEIKWLLKETLYTCQQIAEHYHVNASAIKHINNGRNHFDNNDDYPLRKKKGKKQLQPVEAILAKRSTDTIDTYLEMGVCTK